MDQIPVSYSNETVVSSSNFDIVIGFNQTIPEFDPSKNETIKISKLQHKIIMSPQHFKVFVKIINEQLFKYEEQFGTITVEPKNADKH